MKTVQGQLELALGGSNKCRSSRRLKKPRGPQLWFEKMRQVVEDAAEREPADILNLPRIPPRS
jgi:hypothetical protein